MLQWPLPGSLSVCVRTCVCLSLFCVCGGPDGGLAARKNSDKSKHSKGENNAVKLQDLVRF